MTPTIRTHREDEVVEDRFPLAYLDPGAQLAPPISGRNPATCRRFLFATSMERISAHNVSPARALHEDRACGGVHLSKSIAVTRSDAPVT